MRRRSDCGEEQSRSNCRGGEEAACQCSAGRTLGLWEKLLRFAHDGRLEIDTNLCENAIRPTAVGKKNWLFIGAEGAGQNSAILFTLVAECRRLQLNPQDYFTAALTRLPTATTRDVTDLTPEALGPLLRPVRPEPSAQAA